MLRGDNTTKTLERHINNYRSRFAKPGTEILTWAYGPKIVDQLAYVIDVLHEDPSSRRAVINIWRENPRWHDPPCTLSLQFLIRENMLQCVATMRSSDLWFGWPYDVFCFSSVAAYVSLLFRQCGYGAYELGYLYLNAGSQHIYEDQWSQVHDILTSETLEYDEAFDYYTLSTYDKPASLICDLEAFSHA
jgi:thymidylate synthase